MIIAINPPTRRREGIMETKTRARSHPLTKANENPPRKVEKNWIDFPIWKISNPLSSNLHKSIPKQMAKRQKVEKAHNNT